MLHYTRKGRLALASGRSFPRSVSVPISSSCTIYCYSTFNSFVPQNYRRSKIQNHIARAQDPEAHDDADPISRIANSNLLHISNLPRSCTHRSIVYLVPQFMLKYRCSSPTLLVGRSSPSLSLHCAPPRSLKVLHSASPFG